MSDCVWDMPTIVCSNAYKALAVSSSSSSSSGAASSSSSSSTGLGQAAVYALGNLQLVFYDSPQGFVTTPPPFDPNTFARVSWTGTNTGTETLLVTAAMSLQNEYGQGMPHSRTCGTQSVLPGADAGAVNYDIPGCGMWAEIQFPSILSHQLRWSISVVDERTAGQVFQHQYIVTSGTVPVEQSSSAGHKSSSSGVQSSSSSSSGVQSSSSSSGVQSSSSSSSSGVQSSSSSSGVQSSSSSSGVNTNSSSINGDKSNNLTASSSSSGITENLLNENQPTSSTSNNFIKSPAGIAIIACSAVVGAGIIATVAFRALATSYVQVSTQQQIEIKTQSNNSKRKNNKRRRKSKSQSRARDFTVDIPSGDLSSLPQPRK